MTDVKVTRRDMIDLEQLAGKTFSELFPDGKSTALGTMGMAYIREKKAGKTTLGFDEWLDEELTVEEDAEEANPT